MTYDELVKLEECRSFSAMELEDSELVDELDTVDGDWLGLCAIEATIRVELYWLGIGPPVDPDLVEWYRLFQKIGSAGVFTVALPEDIVQKAREAAARRI